MALYRNTNTASPIASVEFSPVAEGNFSFYALDTPEHVAVVKQWLTSADVGQKIIAESKVGEKIVLVTQGDKSKKDLLQLLDAQGDSMQLTHKDRKFNPWLWRGALSMIGHPMQIASSMMLVIPDKDGPITDKAGARYKHKETDKATFVFAASNIAANLINIFFGGEKQPDKHQLRVIKGEVNDMLDEHLNPGEKPFDIDEKRADRRKGPQQPKSFGRKFHDFMEHNSVKVGEIGLRYFGGISLVMPVHQWKAGLEELFKGAPIKAFKAARNPDEMTFYAGGFWLVGKTIGFFSKVPDPYDPKPHTWVDTMREKVLFRASTAIEALGASTIVVNRFKKRKIAFNGTAYRDYLGSIGGGLFVGAFGMRYFAPFGEKQLNQEELNAHITDTLAKTPPEKIPQLMAEVASTVKEHLKDKLTYGEIYTRMMTDLYRYHHIALENFDTDAPASPPAPAVTAPAAVAAIPPKRPLLDRVETPDSYVGKAQQTAELESSLSR